MDKLIFFGMFLVFIGTLIGSIGVFLFKLASQQIKKNIFSLLVNYKFYLGAFLNLVSAILFVYALRFGDLSLLYPLAGLTYIWTAFFSVTFLKEKMNKYRWLGISLIILGVIFIGLGA